MFYTDLNKVVIGRQAPDDDDLIYVNQKFSLPFHLQLWYTEKVSGYSEVGIAPGLGPGDRAFEPHYSDQNPSEINDFRGIFLFFVYCGADDDITPMLLYANTRHTQKYFIAIMPKLRYDTNIKNVELPRLQGIIWAKYYRFPY